MLQLFFLFMLNKLSRFEREKHRGSGFFFFFGFVENLWFDDVIYGFWVDDWVFYRVC